MAIIEYMSEVGMQSVQLDSTDNFCTELSLNKALMKYKKVMQGISRLKFLIDVNLFFGYIIRCKLLISHAVR